MLGISGEGAGGRKGGRVGEGAEKGRGSAEEKRGERGREVKKGELLVGGSFLVFLPCSRSCGCASCDDV